MKLVLTAPATDGLWKGALLAWLCLKQGFGAWWSKRRSCSFSEVPWFWLVAAALLFQSFLKVPSTPLSLALQCQWHFMAESRGHGCCLVAVQAWFPLSIPRLGLVAQDVGQICEIKQVLFVLLCMCGVLNAVLATRNNVALGVSEN